MRFNCGGRPLTGVVESKLGEITSVYPKVKVYAGEVLDRASPCRVTNEPSVKEIPWPAGGSW